MSLVPITVCVEKVFLDGPLTIRYCTHAVVDNPLAFTVPLRVAELWVTREAESVVTAGAAAEDCGLSAADCEWLPEMNKDKIAAKQKK
ncbi:MAG: hypothetical protein HY607_03935 [Planctomycetes bacterium]|nr:hypothetical protein [Planctomycetota bacterium]